MTIRRNLTYGVLGLLLFAGAYGGTSALANSQGMGTAGQGSHPLRENLSALTVTTETPSATASPAGAIATRTVPPNFTRVERLDCTAYNVSAPIFSLVAPVGFEARSCHEDPRELLSFVRYSDTAKKVYAEGFGFGSLGVVSSASDYNTQAARVLNSLIETQKAQGYAVQVLLQTPLTAGQAPIYRVDMIVDVGTGQEIFRGVVLPDIAARKGLILYWNKVVDNPVPASFQEFDGGAFRTVLDSIQFLDVPPPLATPTPGPTLAANPGYVRYEQARCDLLALEGFVLVYPQEFQVETCKRLGIYYAAFSRTKSGTDLSAENIAELYLLDSTFVQAPFQENYVKTVTAFFDLWARDAKIVNRTPLAYKGSMIERLDMIGQDEKALTRIVAIPSPGTNQALILLWSRFVDKASADMFRELDTGTFPVVLNSIDVSQVRIAPTPTIVPTLSPTLTRTPTSIPPTATVLPTPAAVSALSSTPPAVLPLLIYKYDLAVRSPEFPEIKEANVVAYYPGGVLRVGLRNYGLYRQFIGKQGLKDVSVSVDAVKYAGPTAAQYGLVCRAQDAKNFYGANVAENGYAGIYKVQAGTFHGLAERSGINNGLKPLKEINHLRIDCIGDTLALYVNGALIVQARDDAANAYPSGDVGLQAYMYTLLEMDMRFGNFEVRAP